MGLRTVTSGAEWTAVLNALDIPVFCTALPAEVLCPLCSGRRLTIYEDNISKASWHYCFGCHHAGDVIGLAAAVWDTSLPMTIKRLAAEGVPIPYNQITTKAIDSYLHSNVEIRERLNAFWATCKENLITQREPEISIIKARLRLQHNFSPDRWRLGLSKLVGSCNHRVLDKVFYERTDYPCARRKPLFRGPNWNNVVVTPYYSLPEKICAFGATGRNCNSIDNLWRYALRTNSVYPEDAGLAGLWTVEESCRSLGNYILAVDCPWFMIRMQMRHYLASNQPLPIVSWKDGRHITSDVWRCIDRTPIFWLRDEKLTVQTLHQAMITDGYLCLLPLHEHDQRSEDHYLRNNDARSVARKVIKRAMPWRDFLKQWSDKVSDGLMEGAIHGLEKYGSAGVKEVASLSERLQRFTTLPKLEPEVRMSTEYSVIERNCQWWKRTNSKSDAQGTTIMLLNATLRVDGVCMRGGKVHYKGRIIYKGEEVPFEIPKAHTPVHEVDSLIKVLAEKKGALLYVAEKRCNLISIALAFAHPD